MSLKKNFGKSTLWMSAAASGNSLISFLIFIILSRLLAPTEIGLVAFAMIVVELGKIMVSAGLPHAIVRHHEWDERYSATCFYLNMMLAALVTFIVFFIGAPIIAHYYDPRAELLVKVLSIGFFLEGLKAVHEGKLRREFQFRAMALRTIAGSLLGGVTGVILAFKGYGVWALVCQQLVNQLIVLIVTVRSAHWLPSLLFSVPDARALLAFSMPLTAAQMISNFASKVYEMLVGVLLGPAALGFFRVGGRALFILQEIVLKPFEQTLLPALSRMTEPEQRAQGTLRVIRMAAYFAFPIFFGAAALGPEFIELAFTSKWAQSGQVMTFLALGIAPLVVEYQVHSALTASGKSKQAMILACMNFGLNCLLGFLLVPHGIIAAAAGFALRNYISVIYTMFVFKQIFGVSMATQFRTVGPTLAAAAMMFATVWLIKYTLPNDLNVILRLVVLAMIGALTYTLLMSVIFRKETKHFLTESAALAPEKAKPAINKLQRFLKLA